MSDYDNQGGMAGAFGYGLGETKPVTRPVRRDIYGNAVDWEPTGRRIVGTDGKLRAQMRRGDYMTWMFCRSHEDCSSCAGPRSHDDCPVLGAPMKGSTNV